MAGCAPKGSASASSPTPNFVTATLPPTNVPSPTAIPPSPVPTATPPPIKGVTSTQVYVRREPNSAADELGLLGPATSVQIVGKDPSGSWYQVLYSAEGAEMGWVAAQYVVPIDKEDIPLAADPELDSSAVITQLVNVRDGPGQTFASIGVLNTNDVVVLTARDADSAWVQVRFPAASGGLGWISTLYVRAAGLESLPVAARASTPSATSSQEASQSTPSATAAPAVDDGDSREQPAKKVTFSPTGAAGLIYTSSVSAPAGDPADWIAFIPYNTWARIYLDCAGNGILQADISASGTPSSHEPGPACGKSLTIAVTPEQEYLIRISAQATDGVSSTIRYSLGIDNQQ
jgi:uncharacterized protein YraI